VSTTTSAGTQAMTSVTGLNPNRSGDAEPAVRRARHLLDPNDIHGSHMRSVGSEQSLSNVQRWVMSVLVVTTLEHLAAGLAIAAVFFPRERLDGRIGLNFLAAVVGVLAVAAGLLIHGKRPLSPWLLVGLVPALAGVWFTFI